jgi:hypothetical protein
MTTLNVVPLGIGAEGVITSLVSPHGSPCDAAWLLIGAQGFGLVAETGFVFDAACASGSGSSAPLGSPA